MITSLEKKFMESVINLCRCFQNDGPDWEQRRYEIAKEMLPVLYQQSAEILKCGQSVTWEAAVNVALNFADMLIQKLKEQSE